MAFSINLTSDKLLSASGFDLRRIPSRLHTMLLEISTIEPYNNTSFSNYIKLLTVVPYLSLPVVTYFTPQLGRRPVTATPTIKRLRSAKTCSSCSSLHFSTNLPGTKYFLYTGFKTIKETCGSWNALILSMCSSLKSPLDYALILTLLSQCWIDQGKEQPQLLPTPSRIDKIARQLIFKTFGAMFFALPAANHSVKHWNVLGGYLTTLDTRMSHSLWNYEVHSSGDAKSSLYAISLLRTNMTLSLMIH